MKKLNTDYRQLLRAWALMWQADKNLAVINIILQVLQALLPVVSLYFIKLLIDALTHQDKTYSEVIYIVAGFGLMQFLLALTTQYSAYVSTIHQQKLTDYLAGEVLKKAIAVDYEYYENPAYHDTLHLAQQQSLYKASALLANFNMALLNSLSLLFLIGFFFTQHSLFAILFMVLSVPLAIIKWYSGHALMRIEREFVPLEREANYLHSTLTGVSFAKEVRVFGFGQSFIKKFNTIRQHIHHRKEKLHKKLTWYSLAAEAVEIVVMTIIFVLLAKYTLAAAITVGAFVIYIQGFQRLQSTSKNFLQALVLIFQQRLFLNDLFAFFDIENKSPETNGVPFPKGKQGLTVQNLSFTYPQTQKPVLHNVSLNCERGQIIAIVGENGSGKSTLVKLLAGLYALQSGQINIDDVAIADIEQNALRQNTVFLFQDFEKYFFTVEENIALGELQNGQTPAHMEKAAVLSGAHLFITRLSQQYKTRMGRVFDGSEQLSGGQWQKLALARIFYKNAQLVVLDEPTSALDVTAEFDLFKNIKEHLQHKMVILITHRLYNLKIADHIYVMDDGRIAQQGNFDTLIAADGIFKTMYEAQKL